jgi:myo-inositol-1(or 4)-monophosphatase
MDYPINLTEVENFITNVMPQAGAITKRYFGSTGLLIKEKTGAEVVTEADIEVNNFLTNRLKLEYPDIPILSEESPKKEAAWYLKKELYWVIDPIDGTHNFARGSKDFAICLALCSYDKPIFGIVYAPLLDETYKARADQEPSLISSPFDAPVVYGDFGYEKDSRENASAFIRASVRYTSDVLSLGCASLAICSLSCGRGNIYGSFAIKPWDQAAAGLIAQKSGIILEDLESTSWTPFSSKVLMYHPSKKKTAKLIVKSMTS